MKADCIDCTLGTCEDVSHMEVKRFAKGVTVSQEWLDDQIDFMENHTEEESMKRIEV